MNKIRVIAYGRFNPPTSGHALVMNKVKEIADKHNADHSVILSRTQDTKKNPLSVEDKVKFAKKIAPGVHVEAATKEHPTIMHHIEKAHNEGVEHLHVVAGSDRVEEYKKLIHKYHGPGTAKPFKSITVHSSGERDPDSEGETGISGTKMRHHAANNDIESFHKGLPKHVSRSDAHEMMKAVRHGMGVNESTLLSFAEFIQESIVKIGSKFKLVSKKTGKNLGTYDTKKEAEQRERQVQFFKYLNK